MYVRIARFEGGGPEGPEQTAEEVRRRMREEGPPEGLEGAKRVLLLADRSTGRSLSLVFFATEDELRRGDEALNAMTPEGAQERTAVETYEIVLDEQAG